VAARLTQRTGLDRPPTAEPPGCGTRLFAGVAGTLASATPPAGGVSAAGSASSTSVVIRAATTTTATAVGEGGQVDGRSAGPYPRGGGPRRAGRGSTPPRPPGCRRRTALSVSTPRLAQFGVHTASSALRCADLTTGKLAHMPTVELLSEADLVTRREALLERAGLPRRSGGDGRRATRSRRSRPRSLTSSTTWTAAWWPEPSVTDEEAGRLLAEAEAFAPGLIGTVGRAPGVPGEESGREQRHSAPRAGAVVAQG
jgi:hypothetical protein